MERLQHLWRWLFSKEHWLILVIPVWFFFFLLIGYLQIFAPNPLRDRQTRTAIFDRLVAEIEELELPPNTGVSPIEANHRASLILITKRYRSTAPKSDFFRSINQSLVKRGWVPYRGEAGAVKSYCRGDDDATLYLHSPGIFDADTGGDEWQLHFSAGLRGAGAPSVCTNQ